MALVGVMDVVSVSPPHPYAEILTPGVVVVAHVCSPSYLVGGGMRITIQDQPGKVKCETLYQTQTKNKKGVTQAAEHKSKALSSIPSTTRERERERERERGKRRRRGRGTGRERERPGTNLNTVGGNEVLRMEPS
jgi:hypothetical protein